MSNTLYTNVGQPLKTILLSGYRLYFSTLLILVIVMSNAFAQDPGLKPALRWLDMEQTNRAMKELDKSMAALPTASGMYYTGYAFIKNGKFDDAMQSFERGITISQTNPINYAGKAHVFLLKNKPAEAKTWIDQALTLGKTKSVEAYQAVARAYLDVPGGTQEALVMLDKAKALDKANFDTYMLQGDARFIENKGGAAVSSYEWAAKYNPTSATPPYKIGLVYLKSHDLTMAEVYFQKALGIDPEFALGYKELGELYYLKKDGPLAVKNYEIYLSLTENPDKDQFRYAFFLLMAKEFTKANEVFKNLLKQPEVNPLTYKYYAYSLFESGDYINSQQQFELYFAKADPQTLEASDFAYYGKVQAKLNLDSLALTNLDKSLAMDANQPALIQLQAETYFKNKKYPESIKTFRRIKESGKEYTSQDLYMIGRAYYFNKQYPEADSAFQKLIQLQPAMTVGYLWEARTRASRDPESENGLAKPYYEKLVEMSLPNPEKNRKELLEAYSYLGYYHLLKNEKALSKSYWNKLLALDPNNVKAKEALKAIH